MRYTVVGTAGHIDHGKTALVRALTGIDTDRLQEEKRRGISIDLGFAHLALSDAVRIAFIDVPGHERFIKNMLAGVGGVDSVLFVIAADESIKPQTREHFDICRLLRIPRGVIALTKADLVDDDILQLVRLETQEFVAGSFLESCPILPVSAATLAGLEELRAALRSMAAATPPRDDTHLFRMPIDRSFTVGGFGTVVTGTVLSGSVKPEQEVAVYPGNRTLRVRGVQVHGAAAKRAIAGQRAAINLTGVEHSSLHRGQVLAEPRVLQETTHIWCRFELLSSAKPLKDRAPIHFHAGTAEVQAEIRMLDGLCAIRPGQTTLVRIKLREPLLLLPRDRFIVRMFSPVITIGGGDVLDIAPATRVRRAQALARAQERVDITTPEHIAAIVREFDAGCSVDTVVARTGLRRDAIQLLAGSPVISFSGSPPWLLSGGQMEQLQQRWRERIALFHRENPLLPGISREELRSREMPGAPPWVFDAVLERTGNIVSSGDVLHLASHKLALKQEEQQALARIEAAFRAARLSVPPVPEVLAGCGVEGVKAKSLLQILFREKRLVRVNDELVFHPSALALLRGQLSAKKGQRFSVGDFKEWTGISRKYAIPLLEHLDRERVTRREADLRLVL